MKYKPKSTEFRVSPTHWSPENRVHADYKVQGKSKQHIPFAGQTTIDTFTNPSYSNDKSLAKLGGKLKG